MTVQPFRTVPRYLTGRAAGHRPIHREAVLYVLGVWGGSLAILAALPAIAAVADPRLACAVAGLTVALTAAACFACNLRARNRPAWHPTPTRTIIILDCATHWWFAAVGGAIATLFIAMDA